MSAWEDFGLDVAKWVCVVFGVAFLAGGIWGLTGRLRDWRERVMWDRANAEAQAALDFGDIQRRIDHFTAHVTDAFNVLGYDSATPIHDELAADRFADQLAHLDVYRDEDWKHWGTNEEGA